MKRLIVLFAFAAVFAGCRRTDIRDFTIAIPDMMPQHEQQIKAALAPYGGVVKTSYKFDHQAKTLFLQFDSMQIAKKNIEMAIAETGLAANGVTPASVGK